MADLLKCMECGGIVSSEAHQCPQCKTDREGIRGVECKVCLGLLKFSEATRRSGYFHDSCYQKVSRKIVEKEKTINCPVCQQPNHFSYGQGTTNSSRWHSTVSICCAKCGHPYAYTQLEENDPYSNCMYCRFMLTKNLEVHIKDKYYAHKVCNTKERQHQEIISKRLQELREKRSKKKREEEEIKTREKEIKMREEEIKRREENKKKNFKKKLKLAIQSSYVHLLIPGGLFVVFGNFWGSLVCGILFAIFTIWIIYFTPDDPWL